MKKITVTTLALALVLAEILLVIGLVSLWGLSLCLAQAYPEYAHLRLPTYVATSAAVLLVMAALFSGLLALRQHAQGATFTSQTSRLLKVASWCFLGAALVLVLVLVLWLALSPNGGTIANLYLVLCAVLLLLGNRFLALLVDIVDQGNVLREDHDLTI